MHDASGDAHPLWDEHLGADPVIVTAAHSTMEMISRPLAEYDAFYKEVRELFDKMKAHHGRFVVFDLYAYNYCREGPEATPEDPQLNSEINIGTGTMDCSYWFPVVDRFIHDLHRFDFFGRHLDVRKNIKFVGREFPSWVHANYEKSACVLAVEFKKLSQLRHDGMSFVGLDIVGNKLMEINVFSPGGLDSTEVFTSVKFSHLIIQDLVKKVNHQKNTGRYLSNKELAVL